MKRVKNNPRFSQVTERSGTQASNEQLRRMYARYHWARSYCVDRRVLEVACGSGQGIGYVAKIAKSISGVDLDFDNVKMAQSHYGDRFEIVQMDAKDMSFDDDSFDVIICFEAIYYFSDFEKVLTNCRKILSPNGFLLISSVNPETPDFTPSLYSTRYYSINELNGVLRRAGFEPLFFGDTRSDDFSIKMRGLELLKRIATRMGLVPKSMNGKALIRRLLFGPLITMPSELIETNLMLDNPPTLSVGGLRYTNYKGYFCVARKLDLQPEAEKS